VVAERPSSNIVPDQHNIESDIYKQFAARKSGLKKSVAKDAYRESVRVEERALKAAHAVVAISKEDAKHFDALAGIHAHVVPMVMPFERVERPRPSTPHLCYVGNLRWHPNVAGLDWFCRDVWPKIRARVPEA